MAALEKLNIDTPEQIALEFSIATVGSRFLALAIDTLVQVAAGLMMLVIAGIAAGVSGIFITRAGPWILGLLLIGWFVVYFGYFALFEAVWNGQTPGKRVIGLRVIHASGRPISVYEAILRNVVRIVDQMPGIYAVGIISVFLTERSQRLGDLAAASVVVHERSAKMESSLVETRILPAHRQTAHGASRLTAEEIAVIEMFFRRRDELDGVARVQTAERIAERIRTRLRSTAKITNEELLEEVLAEYRAKGNYR